MPDQTVSVPQTFYNHVIANYIYPFISIIFPGIKFPRISRFIRSGKISTQLQPFANHKLIYIIHVQQHFHFACICIYGPGYFHFYPAGAHIYLPSLPTIPDIADSTPHITFCFLSQIFCKVHLSLKSGHIHITDHSHHNKYSHGR